MSKADVALARMCFAAVQGEIVARRGVSRRSGAVGASGSFWFGIALLGEGQN
jgi:hypothetical protein